MYNRRTKRRLDRRTLRPSVSQLNSTTRNAQQNVIGPNKLTGVLGNLTRRQLSSPAGEAGTSIRIAYVKTTPGADTTVDCYLDTDVTGEEIEVTCSIAGLGVLNAALPRISDGDLIFVANISGTWYCLTVFQESEDCVCS